MNLDKIHSVFFIGIGGIGMSALARFVRASGIRVAGYDRVSSSLTLSLEEEGMEIAYTDEVSSIPRWFLNTPLENALVVYTPAIPKTHWGMSYLREKGYTLFKRSELLQEITRKYTTVAVAGTHGKTTTSAMVAHLLSEGGMPINAFLGGISTNLNSNAIVNPSANIAVVEADEFDRSFLKLSPQMAVITSVEADHLDIYGTGESLVESFSDFMNLIPKNGKCYVHERVASILNGSTVSYALDSTNADITARNIRVVDGKFEFSFYQNQEKIGELCMNYPGRHNLENMLPAIAIAQEIGVNWEKIRQAVSSFAGVKRRFEYHIRRPERIFIDDYAHHPTEIRACLGSVRELYPERRVTGVFQPHLYSRTQDFGDEFARSLEDLNDLLLMEIYPAREEPIEGITSEWLLDKVRMVNKKLCQREELVDEVLRLSPEVLLTMGAGDIDRLIEPLKKALNEQDEENT